METEETEETEEAEETEEDTEVEEAVVDTTEVHQKMTMASKKQEKNLCSEDKTETIEEVTVVEEVETLLTSKVKLEMVNDVVVVAEEVLTAKVVIDQKLHP